MTSSQVIATPSLGGRHGPDRHLNHPTLPLPVLWRRETNEETVPRSGGQHRRRQAEDPGAIEQMSPRRIRVQVDSDGDTDVFAAVPVVPTSHTAADPEPLTERTIRIATPGLVGLTMLAGLTAGLLAEAGAPLWP
ncbi:hypothetical protein [Prauserella flavalba]|uniref:hypothetical protein n=1 Tax=Prauserella flavalba TaxID=1477506 RepID=UPI0036EC1A23